jgi:hypothetical protein
MWIECLPHCPLGSWKGLGVLAEYIVLLIKGVSGVSFTPLYTPLLDLSSEAQKMFMHYGMGISPYA